jgi:hypothetical protein
VSGLIGLHATDPASIYLTVFARMGNFHVSDLERALYEERSLIRMLGMRRTMFVFPSELEPVIQAACTDEIARRQRQMLLQHLSQQGYPENVPDAEKWLDSVCGATLRTLAARGSASAQQLSVDEPRLRQKLLMAKGKSYESIVNVTSRVLLLLAAEGEIVRGRPRGSWLSTQYEWSIMADWLPVGLGEKPNSMKGRVDRGDVDSSRVELARRWLYSFGPAPLEDLQWWTGWTRGQTKKTLARLDLVEVELTEGRGLLLADDLEPVSEPESWVALLPALDPTPMGWTNREWFLGSHRNWLYDRNGNIGPTVWCDGRIVGGWTQQAEGSVVFRLLENVGSDSAEAIAVEADRVKTWLGDTTVVSKFRTPLEQELSGIR